MPHRFKMFLLIVLAIQMLPGCTTRAWYEGVQATAKQACLREPPAEQARCESRLNKQDFDSYVKDQLRK
jgi:hypothetical protein